MTAQQDPYVRVYYRIVDDPKFADVFDHDARLATWLRLLLLADGTYPAPAPIPFGVNKAALNHLVAVGLVDLEPGSRFRIHGMEAERGVRGERAAAAARKRWDQRRGDAPGNASAMQTHSGRTANASERASRHGMHSAPLRSAPLRSEDERAPEDPDDDVTTLQKLAEELTGTPYGFPRHGRMGEQIAAMSRKHGVAAVEREWRRIAVEEGGLPTVRQLVFGADGALNRVPGPGKPQDEVADYVARIKRESAEGARA